MTFWETIRDLRKRSSISRQWSITDIRPLLAARFSPNSIATIPPNQSISRDGKVKGDYVKKGRPPMAFRVGKARYELIDDPISN
jgi:hypothetical protein